MKIHQLQLLAFGPFTDVLLDFGPSDSGLHLIFGRNEAGKSSALRAIDGLLFGIPLRTSDNFVHPYGKLSVGAKVSNADGDVLEFVRRKRQRKSLAKLSDADTSLPDQSLDRFLQGVQRETFQRLYCIDHAEFRAGGERMRALQGLLGESLFAASLGGGGLANLLQQLEDSAAALYGKRSGRIRTEIANYQTARQERSQHEVTGKKWQTLKQEYESVLVRKQEIVRQQTELETQLRRLERLRDALPKLAEWRRLHEALAGEAPFILPSSYSSEDRSRCEATLSETRQQLAQLRDNLRHTQSVIDGLGPAPQLLGYAEKIDALQQRVGQQTHFRKQAKQAAVDQQAAVVEVQRLLQELGSKLSVEEAERLRVRREHRAAILELASHESQLRAAVQRLEERKAEMEAEQNDHHTKLRKLPAVDRLEPLMAATKEVLRCETVDQEISQTREQLARQASQIQRQVAELPDWNAPAETLGKAQVPARETVETFAERFTEMTRHRERLQTQLTEKRHELACARQSIETLLRAGHVVTEEDLLAARNERDQLWQRLKEARQRSPAAPVTPEIVAEEPAEDRFERHIRRCDDVADRLRREADRVASLARDRATEARLETEVTQFQGDLQTHENTEQQLHRDWQALWSGGGLTKIRSPREMSAWLQQRSELLTCLQDQAQLRKRLATLESSGKKCRDQLRRELTAVGVVVDGEPPLATLRAQAEATLAALQQQQQHRRQWLQDQDRRAVELRKLATGLEREQAKLEHWQRRWTKAMEWIGVPAESTATQAIERLRCLDELLEASQHWARLGQALETAADARRSFEQDVAALVQRAAPDLEVTCPLAAAEELKRQLDTSKQQEQALEHHQQLRAQQEAEASRLTRRAADLERQLAQYLSVAGVQTSAELVKVESLSRQAARKRDLEAELTELSGGSSLEEFDAAAKGTDIAELEAQISQLHRAIQEEDTQRDAVVARLTEVKRAMDEVDGNDAAARADQRAMGHLAQIHSDAARYGQLRVAASILRKQIERYRDENKDPLLAKASDFFSQMTLGEFDGLKSDYDDNGSPIIVGLRKNQDVLRVNAMSDGTLDPLYLALRLAYLERRFEQHEPMPLIVDDILIHLDDERALATLQVLGHLSQQTQVLFFTHHQRLKELAESQLPRDLVQVHELTRRQMSSSE